jgi:hypothetical protein
MNLKEFNQSTKITNEYKDYIIGQLVQSILDVNYPGMKANNLSKEEIGIFAEYINDNYIFRFVNESIMNSIICEPKI